MTHTRTLEAALISLVLAGATGCESGPSEADQRACEESRREAVEAWGAYSKASSDAAKAAREAARGHELKASELASMSEAVATAESRALARTVSDLASTTSAYAEALEKASTEAQEVVTVGVSKVEGYTSASSAAAEHAEKAGEAAQSVAEATVKRHVVEARTLSASLTEAEEHAQFALKAGPEGGELARLRLQMARLRLELSGAVSFGEARSLPTEAGPLLAEIRRRRADLESRAKQSPEQSMPDPLVLSVQEEALKSRDAAKARCSFQP